MALGRVLCSDTMETMKKSSAKVTEPVNQDHGNRSLQK
jgi:hypothetical protein